MIALKLALFAALAQAAPPQANIDDAAWLAGRWVGEGLGGTIEETWAPPAAGQMVGHFRLLKQGKVEFYELMLLDVVEDGVRMRVKHFRPDFVGWEEKDGWHAFKPVGASDGELRFGGLILRRTGDELLITITFRKDDGTRDDQLIRLRRAPL